MRIIKGAVLPLLVAVAAAGCGDILDVNNPNNLIEDELDNPAAARSIVNGASGLVARGIGAVLGPYSVATDEAIFIGSRDAWRELEAGNLADPRNEFTDDAFRYFAQGRWMADEAVARVKGFDDAGELVDRQQLARAYLYAAVQYITMGDMFDDFVIASDKQEAGSAVGPTNMVTLYDQAISHLDAAVPIAAAGSSALHFAVLATRARAQHARAVWAKVQPPVNTADPLVNVQGAVDDANAAIAVAASADARSALTLSNDDIAYAGEASIAYNVNQRRELNLGPAYVTLTENRREVTGIALLDPIDDIPPPGLEAEINLFLASFVNQVITFASVREMHLIRAEAALAGNTTGADFTTAINDLRTLDGLTPYSGQVDALDLLIHSRQANLFLQGRRLADLYRFGLRSPQWQEIATAVTTPGTFLPITCIELRGNPNLSGTC